MMPVSDLAALLDMVLLGALLFAARQVMVRARALAAAQAENRELVRIIRLAAAELRGPILALAGHAGAGEAAALLRLRSVAESLLEHAEPGGRNVRLDETVVALAPVLEFAVAQVAAELGHGQRAWRVSPALAGIELLADRRALHQVLLRVLSCAAVASRDGDWIDIASLSPASGWALIIEDEGLGMPLDAVADRGPESRGLGLGLSLARRLMQAHGGTLTIESAPRVGTRTVLLFPRGRVLAGEHAAEPSRA